MTQNVKKTEARQGESGYGVWRILAISLVIAVVGAGIGIYAF